MKGITLFICAVIFSGAVQNSATQSADPMKAWQDFMIPGEAHKRLAKEVGTWEAEVSQWMDPAEPPARAIATNVVTMTMNGLYQIGNFNSVIDGQTNDWSKHFRI